jgi:hypothetical protein
VSTPNPTHLIAEHHGAFDIYRLMFVCRCGETWPALSDDYDDEIALHAAHVVSKLTDAGCSIIYTDRHERLQRGANELGRRLGRQLQDVLDLTGAHDLIDKDGDGDWMRVWERLGELVERGRQYEGARRIEAATTTEEVRAVVAEFLPAAAAEGEKA